MLTENKYLNRNLVHFTLISCWVLLLLFKFKVKGFVKQYVMIIMYNRTYVCMYIN